MRVWFLVYGCCVVENKITVRFECCKDKRKKWRRRRNKQIERNLAKIKQKVENCE